MTAKRKIEQSVTTPLKWPDGWLRTRIQDRKKQAAWKRPTSFYVAGIVRELELLGGTSLLITSNGTDQRDPGVSVYFSRKEEDFSWQDALGLQGIVPTVDQIESAYRARARNCHPDGATPDVPLFVSLSGHRDRAKAWVQGKHGDDHDHVIACDIFIETRLNLAALKMTLGALRTIERCGASSVLDRVMDKSFARTLIPEVAHAGTD